MAPKRKISKAPEADADGPEAVRVKTEPLDLCINGKAGKSLQNAVTYKLSKAPDFVKSIWNGKMRYDKTLNSKQKKEFIEALLETTTFDEPYWIHSKKTSHQTSEGNEGRRPRTKHPFAIIRKLGN